MALVINSSQLRNKKFRQSGARDNKITKSTLVYCLMRRTLSSFSVACLILGILDDCLVTTCMKY